MKESAKRFNFLSLMTSWIDLMSLLLKPVFRLVMPMISGSDAKILASWVLSTSNSALDKSDAKIMYLRRVRALELPHSTRLLKLPWNCSSAYCHFFSAMYILPPHSMMMPMTRGSSIVEAKF